MSADLALAFAVICDRAVDGDDGIALHGVRGAQAVSPKRLSLTLCVGFYCLANPNTRKILIELETPNDYAMPVGDREYTVEFSGVGALQALIVPFAFLPTVAGAYWIAVYVDGREGALTRVPVAQVVPVAPPTSEKVH